MGTMANSTRSIGPVKGRFPSSRSAGSIAVIESRLTSNGSPPWRTFGWTRRPSPAGRPLTNSRRGPPPVGNELGLEFDLAPGQRFGPGDRGVGRLEEGVVELGEVVFQRQRPAGREGTTAGHHPVGSHVRNLQPGREGVMAGEQQGADRVRTPDLVAKVAPAGLRLASGADPRVEPLRHPRVEREDVVVLCLGQEQ